MELHEKIMEIAKRKGPLIPADVASELKINQILSSALLSELVQNGKLKISHVKKGGSPLYFLPEHTGRLEDFTKNLQEKEQRALNLLREKKVLPDFDITPLQRVALRQIKDYAKPFEAKVAGQDAIFWKYFLVSNEEAESIIREMARHYSNSGGEEKEEKENKVVPVLDSGIKKEEKAAITGHSNLPADQKEGQETLFKPSKAKKAKAAASAGDFDAMLTGYFAANKITPLSREILRKNSELDFLVEIPSPVGPLKYYCKAKNKQKCNEADLSSAYVKGEIKKLPVLFLTTGDFTKKAKERISTDFKNMAIQRIGNSN